MVMVCGGARPPVLLAWEHEFVGSMRNTAFIFADRDIIDSELSKHFWDDVSR